MPTMGVAVKMVATSPVARVVVMDGLPGSPTVVAAFEVSTPQKERADEITEMGEAIASRATGLGVNRVIVRRADQSQRPSNSEGPRVRLLCEGAITAALRAKHSTTILRTGQQAGTVFGADKAAMDAAGLAALTARGHSAKYSEAAGAALAALSL